AEKKQALSAALGLEIVEDFGGREEPDEGEEEDRDYPSGPLPPPPGHQSRPPLRLYAYHAEGSTATVQEERRTTADVDCGPLLSVLHEIGTEKLTITIPHPRAGGCQCVARTGFRATSVTRRTSNFHTFELDTGGQGPISINVSYGGASHKPIPW